MFVGGLSKILWKEVRYQLYASLPKARRYLEFFNNSGTLQAGHEDVMTPVVGRRMRDNSSDADCISEVGFSLDLTLPTRNQESHGD